MNSSKHKAKNKCGCLESRKLIKNVYMCNKRATTSKTIFMACRLPVFKYSLFSMQALLTTSATSWLVFHVSPVFLCMLAAFHTQPIPNQPYFFLFLTVSVPHHTHPPALCGIRHTSVPLHWHGRLSSDRRGIWRGLALHRCPLSADEGREEWMSWGWEDLCRCCWSLVLLCPAAVINFTVLGGRVGGQWGYSIKNVFLDIWKNEGACVCFSFLLCLGLSLSLHLLL